MTVKDVMTAAPMTCSTDANLADAIETMRSRNCGFLPVVDPQGSVVGVVTDRDVCNAAAAKHRPLMRVSVRETMSHPVFSCFADENLKTVLVTMGKHHVRRLPVLTKRGHIAGVLSIDDIARATRRRGAPTADDVVAALREINTPRGIEPVLA